MQSLDKRKRAVEDVQIVIHGMRVENAENSASFGEDGVVELLAHSMCNVRLFGQGLTESLHLAFTTTETDDGFCEFPSSEIFRVVEGSVTNHSAVVEIRVPSRPANNAPYFLCIKRGPATNSTGSQKKLWHHQGSDKWLQFRVYERLLPVWMTIVIIISLLFFSALFSGLTLGLMSMDKTDLKILCTTGTELERQYASAIMPVRSHGSLLLCSLLLGNVLVNSVLTILMDDLTSGLIAVVFSTLAIVIFGEIMPQAICSRHGLAIGAKTIYITKFVILLTCVVAFPISKILDYMLGEEIGNVYNRERLKELVKTGTDIEKDEVNIISGALELRKKTVAEVMTKLEDVYMLDYHAILDFETVSEIMKSGFSRIPVYEGQRTNIVAMLFIKDLAFIDPDDNTPLKQLCDFYQNQCYFVFEDLTLDVLFKHFKDGNKGHMAFVTRVNAEGEGDPFYEAIGLVTLEDVIEELIQAEIIDETDVFTDNKSKRKRERKHMKQDFTTFCERRENQRIHISPQLTLATFQYLSTMDAFKPDIISERILRRLIKQDVIYQIKVKNREKGKTDPSTIIYQQGKPVNYFVLVLEGRVEVTVGREEMRFESGPFTYFGTQALTHCFGIGGDSPTATLPTSNTGSLQSVNLDNASRQTFVPDYTVRAITEVFYIKIKRSLYLAAKRATLMENSQKTDDHFDDEVDKLLHSLDEDDKSQESPTLTRNHGLSDRESLQKNSSPTESPRSRHVSVTNPGSPQEANGSVRTTLSPAKNRAEENALLKMFSDKLDGTEKMPENSSHEERTNLLRQSDEIS
ncbi:hypothetical protein RUM44_000953 [Polyplax serrata]